MQWLRYKTLILVIAASLLHTPAYAISVNRNVRTTITVVRPYEFSAQQDTLKVDTTAKANQSADFRVQVSEYIKDGKKTVLLTKTLR